MDGKFDAKLPLEDVITSQYWDTVTRKGYSQPEKELMLAVLKDAIVTYRKNLSCETPLLRDTERWFFKRDDNGLFSFEMVCAMLGLSSERIRAADGYLEDEAPSIELRNRESCHRRFIPGADDERIAKGLKFCDSREYGIASVSPAI